MTLAEDLERIAAAAAALATPGERVAGVIPAEPRVGVRVYLCAFRAGVSDTSWVVLDSAAQTVRDRRLVRDTASIAALCELAEETAAGGDLDDLRAQLVALRITENPLGIDEAEEAVAALQAAIGAPPRVATPKHLDRIGAATRRLELALGNETASAFAEAMRHAGQSAEAFVADVEEHYKTPLEPAT